MCEDTYAMLLDGRLGFVLNACRNTHAGERA